MTLTTTAVQVAYTGDGGTTSFAVTFQFWDDSELQVVKRTIATGAEVTQVLNVDYTVTGGAGANGSISFSADSDGAPTSAQEVHIRRSSATNQAKDLSPATVVPSAAIEEALDRAAMRDQEDRSDMQSRALMIPVTDVPVSGTAPAMEIPSKVQRAVANAVLGFDATTGNPTVVSGATLPSVTVSSYMATVLDDANKEAAATTLEFVRDRGEMSGGVQAGTAAARPAAGSFGKGFYIATNTLELSYSNNSAWTQLGSIAQGAQSTLPSPAVANKLFLETDNMIAYRDTGAALVPIRAALPRGSLAGLGLSLSGSDQDVTIGVGEARVGTAADRSIMNAYVTTPIVKQLDTAGGWVAGNNQAGRPASGDALGANKWHHVFLLAKPDGSLDAGFDDDINAAALLADSTLAAAGFTRFRYVGSVQETSAGSGACVPFQQHGDYFSWTTIPALDVDTSSVDYSSQQNLALIRTPLGVRVIANLTVKTTAMAAAGFTILAAGGSTVGAPADAASPLAQLDDSANGLNDRAQMSILTDTSQQIVVRVTGDTSAGIKIGVHGYVNYRGKFD